jgi:hypothetical protein
MSIRYVSIDDRLRRCMVLANEDAFAAARIFHPCCAVLAAGNIGIVVVAFVVAGIVAVPVGFCSSGSCHRAHSSASVFTRAFAWMASILTDTFWLPGR